METLKVKELNDISKLSDIDKSEAEKAASQVSLNPKPMIYPLLLPYA